MHTEAKQIPIPAVGKLHVLDTDNGQRIGVIRYSDDRRELVIYRPDDPDAAKTSALLTPQEADIVAELVGARGPRRHCVRLDRHTDGLVVLQVLVETDSPGAGRPPAQYGGVVTALIRDGQVLPTATSSRPGDVVVVIGQFDAALRVVDALTRPG